jgi:outer membrane biosynthesis protein TonB
MFDWVLRRRSMARLALAGLFICAALGSAASSPLLLGLSVVVSASLATPASAEAAEVQEEEEEEEEQSEAAEAVEEVVAEAEEEEAEEEEAEEEAGEAEESAAVEEEDEEAPAAAEEEEEDEQDYSRPAKTTGSSKLTDYAALARKSLPAVAVATSGLVVVRLGSMLLSRGSSSGKVFKVRRPVRPATAPAVGLPPAAPVKYVPKEGDLWLDRQLDRLMFWIKARFARKQKPIAD